MTNLQKEKWLDIVKAVKPQPVKVKVESWGIEIYILPLTLKESRSQDYFDDKVSMLMAIAVGQIVTPEGDYLVDKEEISSSYIEENFGNLPADGFLELYEIITSRAVRDKSRVDTVKKPLKKTTV